MHGKSPFSRSKPTKRGPWVRHATTTRLLAAASRDRVAAGLTFLAASWLLFQAACFLGLTAGQSQRAAIGLSCRRCRRPWDRQRTKTKTQCQQRSECNFSDHSHVLFDINDEMKCVEAIRVAHTISARRSSICREIFGGRQSVVNSARHTSERESELGLVHPTHARQSSAPADWRRIVVSRIHKRTTPSAGQPRSRERRW